MCVCACVRACQLEGVKNGTYVPRLEKLVASCNDHIQDCPLCTAKGKRSKTPALWGSWQSTKPIGNLVARDLQFFVSDLANQRGPVTLPGHYCEICEKDDVIFPFQLDTSQCSKCKSVNHAKCWSRLKNEADCPKCRRIESVRLRSMAAS